jgi:hypothetical protein
VHRNCQRDAGLFLTHGQHAIADVLAPHADYVTTALSGVDPEREREPRLAADRVARLVLRDLGLGPCGMPIGLPNLWQPHSGCGVRLDHFHVHGKLA